MESILKPNSVIYKAIALFLALTFLFSAVMIGTLAWQDFTQHKTNEFSGVRMPYSVTLNKYEKDIRGNLTTTVIKGAEFYLYQENDDDTITQIGGRYTTGNDGKISVYVLSPGNYYFLETNPTYAYTYDLDQDGDAVTKYRFTISGENDDADKTITVNAYNQKRYAELKIHKTVKNADNTALTPEQKETQFEFTVTFSDNGTYQYHIDDPEGSASGTQQSITSGGKLYLKHGQTAVLESLPVGVLYTIAETPHAGYAVQSANHRGNIPVAGIMADFRNTYHGPQFGRLNISKQVAGIGADQEKAFNFTVTFSDGGTHSYKINGPDDLVPGLEQSLTSGGTLQLKHGQTAVFEDLPIGLVYTVTEDDYQPQYATIEQNTSGRITPGDTTAAFINQKTMETNTTGFLSVSKQVTGSGGDYDRAFDFIVTFDDDSAAAYTYYIGANAYTFTNGGKISLKHGQTAIFVDLPADLPYTVTEVDYRADGYTTSAENESGVIPADDVASVTFTNDKPGKEETTLVVRKKVTGEVPVKDKDRAFVFTVIINGKETKFTLKDGEEKSFTMPYGAAYEVIEHNYFEDGYIQSITNGYGTAYGGIVEAIQTNTYTSTVSIEISGEKTWNMAADPKVAKPDSITIYLKNGNTVVATKVVKADGNDKWKYTFTAPRYDDQGNQITYTVAEAPIDNFVSTAYGHNITNTYVPSITVNLPVEKMIDGKPSVKSDFTFELTPITSGAPMPQGTADRKRAVMITGEGKTDFGAMRFETVGEYVYQITEKKGNTKGYTYDATVYTATVKVTKDGNGFKAEVTYTNQNGKAVKAPIFKNIYHPDTPVSVKVTKVWDDGNSSKRPASVKVKLYKNGTPHGGAVTLKKSNNWTYTWTGLDSKAKWTVDEQGVPSGYTKKITGNTAIGFVITNILPYPPPPPGETVSVGGLKTWVHGDNPASKHPASITIYVKDGDILIATKEVSEAAHWQWHFELPKYRLDGTEIKYTIDEAPVPDYTKVVNGYNICNIHKSYDPAEKIAITGSKTWEHGTIAADKRPTSITVYVKDGSRIVAERQVTSADNWNWSIEVPKYDDDGRAITYTVSEGNVPYYTHKVNGGNITNTFIGYDYPGDSPRTGDDYGLIFWMILMIASMLAFVVLIFCGRRRRRRYIRR